MLLHGFAAGGAQRDRPKAAKTLFSPFCYIPTPLSCLLLLFNDSTTVSVCIEASHQQKQFLLSLCYERGLKTMWHLFTLSTHTVLECGTCEIVLYMKLLHSPLFRFMRASAFSALAPQQRIFDALPKRLCLTNERGVGLSSLAALLGK